MPSESRHVSARVDRPVDEVYDYTSDPANVPAWAPGLATSVQEVDGRWVAESGMGRIIIDFTGRNDYGVLDHRVTLPAGETVYNPMRVIADGAGSEVVFTLRRAPGVSDEEFERDTTLVQADLNTLKKVLEAR
jgi:hypothetical protein